MRLTFDREPPPVYRRWLTWLLASPDHLAAFQADPIAATRAAPLDASQAELAQLIEAVASACKVSRSASPHGQR
jgi:hypothetical protein